MCDLMGEDSGEPGLGVGDGEDAGKDEDFAPEGEIRSAPARIG